MFIISTSFGLWDEISDFLYLGTEPKYDSSLYEKCQIQNYDYF